MERHILDSAYKPDDTKAYQEFLISIKSQEEILKLAPVLDIESIVAEEATQLFKVARDSGNLKGKFQKQIKDAAIRMNAAATVLTLRTQEMSSTIAFENRLAEMSRELKALREENAKLRRALENIRKKTPKGDKRKETTGNRDQEEMEWGDTPWFAPTSATPLPSSGGEETERYVRESETSRQLVRDGGVSGNCGTHVKGRTEEKSLPPNDEGASPVNVGMGEMEVEIDGNQSQSQSHIADKKMDSVESTLDKKIDSALERIMYSRLFPMLETMIGEVTATNANSTRPPLRSEGKTDGNKVQPLKTKAERSEKGRITTLNPPARNPVLRNPTPVSEKRLLRAKT